MFNEIYKQNEFNPSDLKCLVLFESTYEIELKIQFNEHAVIVI